MPAAASRDGIGIDDRFYLDVAIREGEIVRWHEYSELDRTKL
jgi:hypothetical protein